jgi:ATP-dependent helicase YprA (DUF1998 family)
MNAHAKDAVPPVEAGAGTWQECTSDPKFGSQRLAREHETIRAMLRIYCRDEHGTATELCPECRALLDYAAVRLERCRFQADKPTCAKCPVHCYIPKYREQVKVVMRHAGPRMLWRHHLLAVRHLLDANRPAPSVY